MDRKNANAAIDHFILGSDARNWEHVFISDDAVPRCNLSKQIIYSPIMPPLLNPKHDMVVRGKNEHETGHAKITPLIAGEEKWSKMKSFVVNSMEDLRVERYVKTCSDSYQSDLQELWDTTFNQLKTKLHDPEFHDKLPPINEALIALHAHERGSEIDWTMSPEAMQYYKDALPIYKQWAKADYEHKSGYKSIVDLTDQILDAWHESRENMNMGMYDGDGDEEGDESEKGNGGGEGEGEGEGNGSGAGEGDGDKEGEGGGGAGEGDGDKEGEGSGKGDGDKDKKDGKGDKDGKGKDGKGKGDDEPKGFSHAAFSKASTGLGKTPEQNKVDKAHKKTLQMGTKFKTGGGGGNPDSRTIEDDFLNNDYEEEAIKNELNRIFEEAKKMFGKYRPYTAEDTVEPAPQDKDAFERAYDSIRGITSMLSSYMEQSLRTMSRSRDIMNHDKGALNVHRNVATIAKSLSKNIFTKTVKGISLDTTVSILVDESGSIGRMAADFRRIVIAFSEVLERLGVKFEVIGHTCHHPERIGAYDDDFDRRSRLVIYEHKRFNESYQQEKYRIGSIKSADCNVDGDALLEAFKRCIQQRSHRHIILVFSDGVPSGCCEDDRMLCRNLVDTVKLCRENGVEVYAFGIGTDEPEKFYGKDYFIYLESINDMTSVFFKTTADIITKGKMIQ